mmetsp:Transcript_33415/g.32458  ORF Transcript_33415/g.32458 Transcript_33415/m.32458 type:complete len:96 (+) Transcript_33415:227-514(+)
MNRTSSFQNTNMPSSRAILDQGEERKILIKDQEMMSPKGVDNNYESPQSKLYIKKGSLPKNYALKSKRAMDLDRKNVLYPHTLNMNGSWLDSHLA